MAHPQDGLEGLSLPELEKKLGANIKLGLSNSEVEARLKQSSSAQRRKAQSKFIPLTIAVKRDGTSKLVDPPELVADDVVVFNYGSVAPYDCKVCAIKFPKASGGSVKIGDLIAVGASPCNDPAEIIFAVVLRTPNPVPAALTYTPGEIPAKRTSKPSLELLERVRSHSIIINDASMVALLSKLTCIIIGLRGVVTENNFELAGLILDNISAPADATLMQKEIQRPPDDSSSLSHLLLAAALCPTSNFDPTLANLPDTYRMPFFSPLAAWWRVVTNAAEVAAKYSRQAELCFSNERPYELAVRQDENGNTFTYASASMDYLLEHCTTQMQNGKIVPLEASTATELKRLHTSLLKQDQRVIAFAVRQGPIEGELKNLSLKKDFAFLGALAAKDRYRELVPESLVELERMNIRVILTSSEGYDSSVALARSTGYLTAETVNDIAEKKGVPVSQVDARSTEACVLQGPDVLSELMSTELDDSLIKKELLFTHVTPKLKAFLVDALRSRGDCVAVMAEGPDDSLCLKRADVGICFNASSSRNKAAAGLIVVDNAMPNVAYAINSGTRRGNRKDSLRKSSGTRGDESPKCVTM